MPAPTSITELSTTAASNGPNGATSVLEIDNYMQAHAAFIAQLRDEKVTESDLAASTGAGMVGFKQSGTGAVNRTEEGKSRDIIDAADFIAIPGASDALDQAGVQAAINEAAARGGGRVRVRKPIRNVWNLSALTIPASVIIDDERYVDSGHTVHHATGDDVEMRIHGGATATGEGPTFTAVNNASTGNRNVSFVGRNGPGAGANVGGIFTIGVNDGGSWYPEHDFISPGADGLRSVLRAGYGTAQVNANTSGAAAYTANKIFQVNKPAPLGGGTLLEVGTTVTSVHGELRVKAANSPIRHCAADGTIQWSWLTDYPSAGQCTLVDHATSANKISYTSGGDTVHLGTLKPSTDNTVNLGAGGNRWGTIYAGSGAINTSDESEKDLIQAIEAAAMRAAEKINFFQFKFKDAIAAKGDGARWHFGGIAQQVKAAFESEGLDPFAFGVLCYDEWEAEYKDVVAEDGEFSRQIERQKTIKQQLERKEIQIIDGVATLVTITEEFDMLQFLDLTVFDESGGVVMVIDQPAQKEVRDENGEIIAQSKAATYKPLTLKVPEMETLTERYNKVKVREAGSRYGVRYDELLCLKMAVMEAAQ